MYIDFKDPTELVDALSASANERSTFLVMLSDTHRDQLEQITNALNDSGIRFYGAVFPGLIQGREQRDSGAIIKQHEGSSEPLVISLKDTDDQQLKNLLPVLPADNHSKPSITLFIDCLAPGISGFLDTLFNHYANSVTFFGGGAGNSKLEHAPCVFSNQGVFTESAVLCMGVHGSTLNVKHGWERVEGPFIATSTQGNLIQELNWEPALDVYRRALPEALRDTPAEDFFTRVTPVYPFSIEKDGTEDIVRDPVGFTEEGGIRCISDVTENSVMYMVHGQQEKLVAAASDAVAEIVDQRDTTPDDCLICDCFSRAILFGEQFGMELDSIADQLQAASDELHAEGALVLGEIASDGEQSLEFYNKTFVVSLS